jgi:hypothetical protein
MPQITVDPLVFKDVIATIGAADAYEQHCSQILFTPASAQITWQGLTPASVHTDTATATWSCQFDYVQDWETPDSLARFLYANEGAKVPFKLKPRRGSGPEFEATLIIVPGAIGGAINTFGATSVTLGCTGRPVLVDSAPPAAWAATTVYDVGDRVSIDAGAVVLRAMTDGTSDAVEPAAPGAGAAVIDGTVAWLQTA